MNTPISLISLFKHLKNHSFIIILITLISVLPFSSSYGQLDDPTTHNIVPNHSFENFSGTPIGWYYKGAHFDNVMRFWNSPTSTSPDIFGKSVRVPNSWKNKGFGDQTAFHGERFVGITLYGCSKGKPHCREYLQIQLEEPLVVGQRYKVQFYVSHLPRSTYCNNIGVHFSEKQYEFRTEELLSFEPQVIEKNIATVSPKGWKKVSQEFVATTPASYLIIGNFKDDENTQTRQLPNQDFNYSYYYVDNISVVKSKPLIEVPIHSNELLNNKIKAGEIIVLKNIFFDLNKSELLPLSYVALMDLIDLMNTKPNLRIEIRGHTDNQGNKEYNQELSFKRAKSVVDYLIAQGGIQHTRLEFKGLGDTLPCSSNTSLEGRQQNRRVEFRVLSE